MKLVVGLGNPDEQYDNTRHNVGHMIVDALKEMEGFILAKNTGFMNTSGASVRNLLEEYSLTPQDLVLIHDDWAFGVGEFKIQVGRSANRHNGVQSVIDHLQTKDFYRIRVGIGQPPENMQASDFVLDHFTEDELEEILFTVDPIKKELISLL